MGDFLKTELTTNIGIVVGSAVIALLLVVLFQISKSIGNNKWKD